MAEEREVHRTLHLTSPPMEGPDVRGLQRGVSSELDHRELDFGKPRVDGHFTRDTCRGAVLEAFAIGLSDDRIAAIKRGRITKPVQHLLRNPEDRTAQDRERDRRRREQIRKIRRAHNTGPKKAAKWARSKVGVTESPAGSNWGPEIGEWIKFTGYGGPVFWCGCFVCFAVVKIGGAEVPTPVRIGNAPYICEDARNGTNGFLKTVSPAEARAGDIITFFGGEHIGLCVGRSREGMVHTIDGNTSSTLSGSQTNGGGVFEKHRSFSDVDCVARLAWRHVS